MLRKFEENSLFAVYFVFCIGSSQHRHNRTFDTKAWFNDVWDEPLVTTLYLILHVLTRVVVDVLQIKISSVCKAHKFFAADREIKLEIDSALRVMRAVGF